MDTSEVVDKAADEADGEGDGGHARPPRAPPSGRSDVVADVADTARSAVETHAPAVRDAAEQAVSAVQTRAPAVLRGRSFDGQRGL